MWIGLSGGIGCGKTTVAELLRQKGWGGIDADQLAHECLRESEIIVEVSKIFGKSVLGPGGELNRSEVAAQAFADRNKLSQLENLVHPCVQRKVQAKLNELRRGGKENIFYDVPLLFEKNMQNQFDGTICVVCERSDQLERLQKRSALKPAEALARISAQMPLGEKRKLADWIIENSGSLLELEKRVDNVIMEIKNKTKV